MFLELYPHLISSSPQSYEIGAPVRAMLQSQETAQRSKGTDPVLEPVNGGVAGLTPKPIFLNVEAD